MIEEAQRSIREVLEKELQERKKINPRYSLRSYAQQLNISASALSEILKGTRALSRTKAQSILNKVTASPELINHILQLFPSEKRKPAQSKKPSYKTITNGFQIVSDWKYFAILSLLETCENSGTIDHISKRLNISKSEVQKCVNLLCKEKMLQKTDKETYALTGHHFTTSDEIPDRYIQKSHLQNFELATEKLQQIPLQLRDFTAMTMAIDPQKLPRAKKYIREFYHKISGLLEKDNKKEVYKLCIQLFPLTKINNS